MREETEMDLTLNEGTYAYGSEGFDLLRRLLNVGEEHCSFPNGSAYTSIHPVVPPREWTEVDGYRGQTGYRYGGGYRMRVVAPDGAEYAVEFQKGRRGPGADFGVHFYTRDDLWEGSSFTLTRIHAATEVAS